MKSLPLWKATAARRRQAREPVFSPPVPARCFVTWTGPGKVSGGRASSSRATGWSSGAGQLALLGDDAEAGLAHAIALGGATPNLRSLRSIFLRVLERYEEARQDLEAVLKANPSDASAWVMHAEILALNPIEGARRFTRCASRFASARPTPPRHPRAAASPRSRRGRT